jgi:hypothetical protein
MDVSSTILVEPERTGRWTVRRAGEAEPLSRHDSLTDAARAARPLGARIVTRDRYGRVSERAGAAATG